MLFWIEEQPEGKTATNPASRMVVMVRFTKDNMAISSGTG
jgi:hypothetical protein